MIKFNSPGKPDWTDGLFDKHGVKKMSKRMIDIKKGDVFENLVIEKELPPKIYKNKKIRVFECKCKCGNTTVKRLGNLRSGRSRWCESCSVKEMSRKNKKHGKRRTKSYLVWTGMKTRCYNKNSKYYKDYGGRNITVCERWMTFENFYRDMGDPPKNKSLERIDNDKGYCPENCKWAGITEQANNKRNNRFLKLKGKEMTVAQWSKKTGIKDTTITNRIDNLGWSVEKALTRKAWEK